MIIIYEQIYKRHIRVKQYLINSRLTKNSAQEYFKIKDHGNGIVK